MEGLIHLLANVVSKIVGGMAGVLFSAMMTISVAAANKLTGADWQETAEWKSEAGKSYKIPQKTWFP